VDDSPFLYTLDLLLPVVSLHVRDAWIAHGAAQVWSMVLHHHGLDTRHRCRPEPDRPAQARLIGSEARLQGKECEKRTTYPTLDLCYGARIARSSIRNSLLMESVKLAKC